MGIHFQDQGMDVNIIMLNSKLCEEQFMNLPFKQPFRKFTLIRM